MKTLLLLFLSLSLFGAHIDDFSKEMNFQRDYSTALQKAQKENKLLVMVLSADYCPWCRKFENKTLKSSSVKSRLNNEVVSLVVDKKFDVESFPKKFTTQFTPRIFFINPKDETILEDKAGYVKKKEFLNTLDSAKNKLQGAK